MTSTFLTDVSGVGFDKVVTYFEPALTNKGTLLMESFIRVAAYFEPALIPVEQDFTASCKHSDEPPIGIRRAPFVQWSGQCGVGNLLLLLPPWQPGGKR